MGAPFTGKPVRSTAGLTPGNPEFTLARAGPKGSASIGFRWFEAPADGHLLTRSRTPASAVGAHRVASVPSTNVEVDDSTPPQPWATAISAPGT